jgi:hypothetical protein
MAWHCKLSQAIELYHIQHDELILTFGVSRTARMWLLVWNKWYSMLRCELKILHLFYLPKLKHIWKNHGQILGFECLGRIGTVQCNDLEYAFPDVSMVTTQPFQIWFLLVWVNVRRWRRSLGIIVYNRRLPSLKCFSQSSFPCYVEMPQCTIA